MQFDEDDFYDEDQSTNNDPQQGGDANGDEEFIEDDLPDDEYDLLYQQLPIIKTNFKDYNNKDLTDEIFKKYLWLNYFNLDDTIQELKATYKNKPNIIMAASITKLHIGGSSKLAKLAAKRAAARKERQDIETEVNDIDVIDDSKAISILDTLGTGRGSGSGIAGGSLSSVPRTSFVRAKLKPKVKAKAEPEPVLEQEKEKEKENEPVAAPAPAAIPSALPKPIQQDNSLLIPSQTQLSDLIMASDSNKQKRKREQQEYNNNHRDILKPIYTNDLQIVKKITTNFNKPSPDDVILQAQSNAFDDLEKLSISKTKQKNPDSSPVPGQGTGPIKALKKNNKIDYTTELNNLKPQLSFVIFGHVDSGKSTIVGRMLYDLKIVDSKTLHKLQQESDKIGKGSFALAWIMDQTDEERTRGVTVDIVTTSFETSTAKFTIIDSPGHQDFVPQLINGISQADLGILLIDCNDSHNGFKRVEEQVLISKNLGIDQLIVALNKFDLISYDTAVLESVIEELIENLVNNIGYKKENISFVPVSGLIGDNIIKKSNNFEWPNTLLESLEKQVKPRTTATTTTTTTDNPFVMTLVEILNDTSATSSTVSDLRVNTRVNSGYASTGDEIVTLPHKAVFKIQQPSTSNNNNIIASGDFINSMKLKPSGSTSASDIALLSNSDIVTNQPDLFQVTNKVKVNLQLFQMSKPLLIGTQFVLFHNCKQYSAKIVTIEALIKSENKMITPFKKKHLVSLQNAIVIIELDQYLPYCLSIDKFTRIVIRKDGHVIGCGKIE